jgi:hypothetical protein
MDIPERDKIIELMNKAIAIENKLPLVHCQPNLNNQIGQPKMEQNQYLHYCLYTEVTMNLPSNDNDCGLSKNYACTFSFICSLYDTSIKQLLSKTVNLILIFYIAKYRY